MPDQNIEGSNVLKMPAVNRNREEINTDLHVDDLLLALVKSGGSDLQLRADSRPYFHLNGKVVPVGTETLSGPTVQSLVYGILTDADIRKFETDWDHDTAHTINNGEDKLRFRVNIHRERGHVGATFRAIQPAAPRIDDLFKEDTEVAQILKGISQKEKGLVLLTGPTGSGKSTTLAAMVRHINETSNRHIVTIEDPIEYVHENIGCVVTQREVGKDTKSFEAGLRASLRQAPMVILMGEMRDQASIQETITAAETGHLVLATVHSNNPWETMERMLDSVPDKVREQVQSQLSKCMLAVVSQHLLPRVSEDINAEGASMKGRVAAVEILTNTPAVGALIRKGNYHQLETETQTGKRFGMRTLDASLLFLAGRGIISDAEAQKTSRDPANMEEKLQAVHPAPSSRPPIYQPRR